MTNLFLFTSIAVGFTLFFAYLIVRAVRTGVIKGGWGRPINRKKQPKTFAVALGATSFYAGLSLIAMVFCICSAVAG